MSRHPPPAEKLKTLTQAEADCLRRVLDHRTAKEIAIELGITHHAVEKRLKRAREKLGAHSSIEAARWYAKEYGCSAYGSSDLAQRPGNAQSFNPPTQGMAKDWRKPVMITTTLAFSLMLASSQTQDAQSLAGKLENTLSHELEIAAANFERLDKDSSGFIERSEFVSPFSSYLVKSVPDGGAASVQGTVTFEADAAQIKYVDSAGEDAIVTLRDSAVSKRREQMFNLMDRNEDGQLDRTEFRMAHLEGIGPKTFTVHLDNHDG